MAGEFALLRRPAIRIFDQIRTARTQGRNGRSLLLALGVCAFIFVQPLIVAAVVLWLLTDLHPQFAANALRDLRQILAPLLGN